MDIDTALLEAEERMTTTVDYFQRELRGVRTGRATTALLEYVKVDYYGSSTDLRELAAINVADATTLLVKPFDPSSKGEIVKSIESAGIGVRAVAEGNAVRVSVPAPSSDRRKQLVTQVKKMAEESRWSSATSAATPTSRSTRCSPTRRRESPRIRPRAPRKRSTS